MNSTISLGQYLGLNKVFVVPPYQRGYVWGKLRPGEKDSVTYLLDDINVRFRKNPRPDLFLQGVTVTEKEDEIVLIDGQQRTTCLYLLLKWLGYNGRFSLRYDIRSQSNKFLNTLDINDCAENRDEQYQDVYYFKKTLRLINEKFEGVDKADMLDYLLEHVKFLYINIGETLATRVFSMMNGNKATMAVEELIKAEMLRLVSQDATEVNKAIEGDQTAIEWEHNAIRSRYAREWDKWLQWWNRPDVQRLYRCSGPMGLLLKTYYRGHNKKDEMKYESFRNIFFSQGSPLEAKQCFDALRRLQKRFEDAFNDPRTHNMVGAIMLLGEKDEFVQYYFVNDHRDNLSDYYMQVFLGVKHNDIIGKDKEKFIKKYEAMLDKISNDYAYNDDEAKEAVFRHLLRLNIDQDSAQGRKFNFDIWGNRSLEHIWSKSKVKHEQDGVWYDGNGNDLTGKDTSDMLDRATISKDGIITTEHSIGNMVLLYKNENSKFNDSAFDEKKAMFFSPLRTELFKSRHLLHTVCVFAEKMRWDGESIAENKNTEIQKFQNDYQSLIDGYNYGN